MTENKNFKMEQEAFLVRRTYEKELHSNKNVLSTLGFMAVLAIFALASQGQQINNTDTTLSRNTKKTATPVCSQKVNVLCLKNSDEYSNAR